MKISINTTWTKISRLLPPSQPVHTGPRSPLFMSAGQSTSQAAALAAFKAKNPAGSTATNPKTQKLPEKPVLQFTGRVGAIPRPSVNATTTDRLPQRGPGRPQLSVVTGNATNSRHGAESRQRSISPLPQARSNVSRQVTSPSSSSAALPLDMIKSVKDSIEAKRHASEAKRLASENLSNDMLAKIRQSINDRTKAVPSAALVNERNRAAINGVKESIENKRIRTANRSMVLEASDLPYNFAPPDDFRSPYETNSPNYSYSSLDSVPLAYSDSEINDLRLQEQLAKLDQLRQLDSEPPTDPETPSIVVDSPFQSLSEVMSPRDASEAEESRIVSPISIPPSLHASARSANVAGSAEIARSHLSSLKFQVDKERSEEQSKKPRRKPPPELSGFEPDAGVLSDSSSLNPGSSRSLLDAGSFLTDNESTSRPRVASNDSLPGRERQLPRFPPMDDGVRGKKWNQSGEIVGEINAGTIDSVGETMGELESEMELDFRSSTPVSRSTAPPLQLRKLVQLKTTMRDAKKKKKREDRAFDVDKPWKNHRGIDRISDADRKRYEGVWASNRGLYFEHVVTRIHGVAYNTEEAAEQKPENEEEDSTKAARLSALQQASTVLGANGGYQSAEFHHLNSAETNQLILNSVVARIWERSGLPAETLREIWELVDFRKDGTLNKPEFLVGTWLVDQCLYGRKLTKKVPASVWESLEGIGVTVKKKGKR